MQSQASPIHPGTHITDSTRSRNPVSPKPPANIMPSRADLGDPGQESQPVDGHRNVWKVTRSRLPWLRHSKHPSSIQSRLADSAPGSVFNSLSTSLHDSGAQIECNNTAVDEVGIPLNRAECFKVYPTRCEYTINIHDPQSIVSSTTAEILAPHKRGPRCAAKLLHEANTPDPAVSLAKSLQQYESLLSQVVSVANDATDYIITTRVYDKGLLLSPCKLDGVDEEYYSAQGSKSDSSGALEPLSSSPHERSNAIRLRTPDIPARTLDRVDIISPEMSPKALYATGAAAEYYKDSPLPDHLPVGSRSAEKKRSSRLVCAYSQLSLTD